MFSRTQKINLSPIKQIEILASKIPDVVSLAQGVPSFDTPEVVKKAAIKALNRGVVKKYSLTYGLPELRETIEQKLAEEGMYYDFEKEIIVTAGAIEAITASLITLISDTKKEVILFSPSYASYQEAIKVAGGKPIFVNLMEDTEADRRGFNKNLEVSACSPRWSSGEAGRQGRDSRGSSGWRIDFKSLERKINSKTTAILFCNPNNPTGTIFPKEDLLKIADLAEKKKFFIISDEVYKDFVYTEQYGTDAEQYGNKILRESALSLRSSAFFSLAQLPELRKRIIRIFSLSKAYAMTGWRIGFLHSDEENVKEILKVHDSLVTCAPVISQYAAIAALDFANEEIEKFRQEYQRRRDLICRYLDDLSNFFSYQKPNSSYFIFPKLLPKRDSWQFSLDLLEKAHVAVVPGIAFGPSGESHIRMSFGRSEKDINEAFNRIKKYFTEQ